MKDTRTGRFVVNRERERYRLLDKLFTARWMLAWFTAAYAARLAIEEEYIAGGILVVVGIVFTKKAIDTWLDRRDCKKFCDQLERRMA